MEDGGADANPPPPPPKRMRRPNVRLQQPYYDDNPRRSKAQHLNSNSNQEQEIAKGSNVDDAAIGDWGSFDSDRVVRKKRVNKKRSTQRGGGGEGNLGANNADDENKEIGDSNDRVSEDCNGGDGEANLGFEKRGENLSEMEGNDDDGDDDDRHNLENKGFERGGQESSEAEKNNSGVMEWLSELGLAKYGPLFEFNEVDDDVLPLLTLEDLKDMGITAVGARRKMYTSIQKLRRSFS